MFKAIKKFFSENIPVDEQAIITEIHNEFDTAGEKLLKEAKEILSTPCDIEKGNRLKNLGFIHTEAAIKSQVMERERIAKMELAKTIEYFQTYYPNYKFITEDVVKKICEKYSLYCADVGFYKGDVPEKNISEMEAFKLRDEDKESVLTSSYDRYISLAQAASLSALRGRLDMWEAQQRYMNGISGIGGSKEEIRKVKRSFVICAPEKDFNTQYLVKSGHKLEFHIPDPIVLQPVKGGFLIVSKWGLEASDELVQNEKMN